MPSSIYPIHDLLKNPETLLGQLLRQARAIEDLNDTFLQILKPELIPHCRVGCYATGILTLFTDSAAYATQLRYQVPTLLSNLRTFTQWAALRSIQIKIQSPWLEDTVKPIEPAASVPKKCLNHDTASQLKDLIDNLQNQTQSAGTQALVSSLERLLQHRQEAL